MPHEVDCIGLQELESFNSAMVCKRLLYTSKATCGSAFYQQVTLIFGYVLSRTRQTSLLNALQAQDLVYDFKYLHKHL